MKTLYALMIASCMLSVNALQAAEKKVEQAPAADSTGLTPALGALGVSDKDALAKKDDGISLPPSALSSMPKEGLPVAPKNNRAPRKYILDPAKKS